MNQTDLIQNILDMEHQAQALTEEARVQSETLDASIEAEINALRAQYQNDAERYLAELEQTQRAESALRLQELDAQLSEKLAQVDNVYAEQKSAWVNSIFQRIVGKAGD